MRLNWTALKTIAKRLGVVVEDSQLRYGIGEKVEVYLNFRTQEDGKSFQVVGNPPRNQFMEINEKISDLKITLKGKPCSYVADNFEIKMLNDVYSGFTEHPVKKEYTGTKAEELLQSINEIFKIDYTEDFYKDLIENYDKTFQEEMKKSFYRNETKQYFLDKIYSFEEAYYGVLFPRTLTIPKIESELDKYLKALNMRKLDNIEQLRYFNQILFYKYLRNTKNIQIPEVKIKVKTNDTNQLKIYAQLINTKGKIQNEFTLNGEKEQAVLDWLQGYRNEYIK